MKVEKAVVPAAGIGTRFLPITKALPKEMLPLVNMPLIQTVFEEALDSGIRDIILVTSEGKSQIDDYFSIDEGLESLLEATGKLDMLQDVSRVSRMVDVKSVIQEEARGLGHAILCAKDLVGENPFTVLLPDDLIDAEVPCVKQLSNVYNRFEGAVIALQEVPDNETHLYGIAEGTRVEDNIFRISGLVEKPPPGQAPSNLAVIGRYVLHHSIFDLLSTQGSGKGGEIQLTDSLHRMAQNGSVYGVVFEGSRHDAGDILGFLKANIHYALKDDILAPELKKYMKEVLEGPGV